jgi:DNA-directed RNA polymerase subunit beta
MTADEEDEHIIAQASEPMDEKGRLNEQNDKSKILRRSNRSRVEDKVDYIDVSPKQLVSVGSSNDTFLRA